MKKIRVAVLYGGRSGEHEISLRSAASVVRALDPVRFTAIPIGIDKQGSWWVGDLPQLTAQQATLALPNDVSVVLNTQAEGAHTQLLPLIPDQNLSPTLAPFDVVFPVLHGPMGEDGTVQGLLELANLPYVGCGVLASAVSMDKDIAKRLVMQAGLPVAPYLTCKKSDWLGDQPACLERIMRHLSFPLFVKPANLGSSVGIHKVNQADELVAAIDNAFSYDEKILLEVGVNAREIEVAVLQNAHYGAQPLTSIPGEIIPQHEFYSYEAKYLDEKGAVLTIPAALNEKQTEAARQMAAQIFDVLACEGMARVDLFLEKTTGQYFFNELNTIPGFTSISMYPKLWEASGISYTDLLSQLIDLALTSHERKGNIKRTV